MNALLNFRTLFPLLITGLLVLALARALPAADAPPAAAPDAAASGEAAAQPVPNHIVREGLSIEFDIQPFLGSSASGKLLEADQADVRFTITDAESGEPVSGLYPVVWMDIAEAFDMLHGSGGKGARTECKDRVAVYLQGIVGVRPLIDLNSYFVMILNQDPTITVIDPIIGVTGRTNLYAQIVLKRRGADWDKTADEKRMFVSMPVADQVAVVDLQAFSVSHNIPAGDNPQRVLLQEDGRYLWVGNDSRLEKESGVSVIDTASLDRVKFIPTGKGHHEIVLSSADRYAFVSNRDEGSVTVIDVEKLEVVKQLETGTKPIALAYSGLSDALYIVDGGSGEIAVVDGKTLEVSGRIATGTGLGPLRFSGDGRWGVAVNPAENRAYIIDTATNSVAHRVEIEGRPFHVVLSPAFAYIRTLDTEWVHMINLKQLGKSEQPLVTKFTAGKAAPGVVRDLSIADTIVPAPGEASVLITSPADLTVYYYMEGMNAPMGNFRNYGHRPRAVQVADRTLKEHEPGVYSAKVKIPAAGIYDVAFLLDTPRMLHCFEATAEVNPLLQRKLPAMAVEYLTERFQTAGETVPMRFRLTDPATEGPHDDLKDVRVLYYSASTRQREEVAARPVGDGVYEATLKLKHPEAYYVFVSSPELEVAYEDVMFYSLLARPATASAVPAKAGTGEGS